MDAYDLKGYAPKPAKKATAPKIGLVCLECDKRFKVGASNPDPRCPKCGGVDYEVA